MRKLNLKLQVQGMEKQVNGCGCGDECVVASGSADNRGNDDNLRGGGATTSNRH